jgi:Family of unknown function (DUF6519)/Right handed beta helix region
MPGDYTRFTFKPVADHLGVLMQQGRVLLDADFNELVEILDRRFRVETVDIIGRCTVPRETPDGFRIQIAGTNALTIGAGRLYADGLLAENHGKAPLAFDPVPAESRGTLAVPYLEQPYLPNAAVVAPPPAAGGPHLVYADVWQREITAVEDPDLVEKAVGVDTATRLQTVWQVKVLANVGGGVTCATPDKDIPGWSDIIRPSAGRLTTSAVGVPASDDPCIVNAAGGYRGTENRLYRVEVHDRGALGGTATWKWSRDNGSIATAVTSISAGRDQLTVVRTGRDAVLRFSAGDWVEVTDDWHELAGKPGVMRKLQQVDDVTQVLTLAVALPAGEFDLAAPASRHTRVRRWDQKGLVLDPSNAVAADVDASGGVIPVPAARTLVLEDGVAVTFSADPAGGELHSGDYWVFAARTADASVEELEAEPPRGIHHHFCRLAVVTFPQALEDCRTLWPPESGEKGCDCTVCVSAEQHNSGAPTIQTAIEQVRATGGKVCLGPGVFQLTGAPVSLQGAQSVELHGHGWRTVLLYNGEGPALTLSECLGVTLSDLTVVALGAQNQPNLAVLVQNSILVRVERCALVQFDGRGRGAAVGLSGIVVQATLRDNVLFGATGVRSLASGSPDVTLAGKAPSYVLTFGLDVEDNWVLATVRGIAFDGLTLHVGDTRISGNAVFGGNTAAIVSSGFVLDALVPPSRLDIRDNSVQPRGDGIVVATDGTRVCGNDVAPAAARPAVGAAARGVADGGVVLETLALPHSGIVLSGLVRQAGIARCQVIGNRVAGVSGDGIAIHGRLESALIKQNQISAVGGGGIAMSAGDASAGELAIENNQVLDAGTADTEGTQLAAIRVVRADQATVAGNTVRRFALAAVRSAVRAGIQVVASSSVRIAGNDLADIGPAEFVRLGAGIEVLGSFDRLDVVDNAVRRALAPPAKASASIWLALLIFPGDSAASAGPPTGGPRTFQIDSGFTFVPVGKAAAAAERFLFIDAGHVVVLPIGREVLAVRGNLLETYGAWPAALVLVAGSCMFNENRCVTQLDTRATPVVGVETKGALIVNANYVERQAKDAVAMGLAAPQGSFTILGNVANGELEVNGAPLPSPPASPWRPLNVIAP